MRVNTQNFTGGVGGSKGRRQNLKSCFVVLFVKMNQVIDKLAKAIQCSVNSVMFKHETDIAYIVIIIYWRLIQPNVLSLARALELQPNICCVSS